MYPSGQARDEGSRDCSQEILRVAQDDRQGDIALTRSVILRSGATKDLGTVVRRSLALLGMTRSAASRCVSVSSHIQLPRPKRSEKAHAALPLQHAADERAESVGNGIGLQDGLQLRGRIPQPERNLGRHAL